MDIQKKAVLLHALCPRVLHIIRFAGNGKMPEWTNGPHSKCGVRVTVPGVRIPLFPLEKKIGWDLVLADSFYFFLNGGCSTR